MRDLLYDTRVAGPEAQPDAIHAPAQPDPPDQADTSGVHGGKGGGGARRLGRGELRSLVEAFMTTHAGQVYSPAQVAAALDRSSGAVGNALGGLATAGTIQLASSKPRRYRCPVAGADHDAPAEPSPAHSATDAALAAKGRDHASPDTAPAPSPHAAPHQPHLGAPASAPGAGPPDSAGTAGDRIAQRAAALATATRALAAFRAEHADRIDDPTRPAYDPTTDAYWLEAFLAICHDDPDAAAQALAQARHHVNT